MTCTLEVIHRRSFFRKHGLYYILYSVLMVSCIAVYSIPVVYLLLDETVCIPLNFISAIIKCQADDERLFAIKSLYGVKKFPPPPHPHDIPAPSPMI